MNIAFVPVRGGSKSIPGKNIKELCGRPLLFWCLNALQSAERIDKIVVATDSEDIREVALSFNMPKVSVFDRNPKNASDESSTESVMLEYLTRVRHEKSDLFVLAQATSPLTESQDIDGAVDMLIRENSDSLLTCIRSKRFFWREDGKPINYDFMDRPRRQDFPGVLVENGALYIASVGAILESKNRLSGRISIYEMSAFKEVEIDEPSDWFAAETLLRRHILSRGVDSRGIKLFLTDVDGTLTDGSMYYCEDGFESKRFNTRDGKGFELLRAAGIKTGVITSEVTPIVNKRVQKLKIDHVVQGVHHGEKLTAALRICEDEGLTLDQVAYVGDDINCRELLEAVGLAACPHDAHEEVAAIPGIRRLSRPGGRGCVREFIDYITKDMAKSK